MIDCFSVLSFCVFLSVLLLSFVNFVSCVSAYMANKRVHKLRTYFVTKKNLDLKAKLRY